MRTKTLKKEREIMDTTLEKGMALERRGDISDAITLYKESINNGSKELEVYDRLIILCRSQNDLHSESEVIHKALEVFSDDNVVANEYAKRLKEIEEI